jgi:hypothetical protein
MGFRCHNAIPVVPMFVRLFLVMGLNSDWICMASILRLFRLSPIIVVYINVAGEVQEI